MARSHLPRVTLNTDGQRHPRENALAAVAVALAVVSLLCAFAPDLHFVGSATGLVGVLVGVFDQYVSATRAERMVIVPAIVGAALGLALGVVFGVSLTRALSGQGIEVLVVPGARLAAFLVVGGVCHSRPCRATYV